MKQIPIHKEPITAMLRQIHTDYVALQQKMADTHGDISRFSVFGNEIIILNNPEYIKEVLVAKRANYPKCKRFDLLIPLGGRYSLFFLKNTDVWRKDRSVIFPFLSSDHFPAYCKLFTENCLELLEQWEQYADKDIPMNVNQMFTYLTLKNLTQTLFPESNFDYKKFSKLARFISEDIHTQLKTYFYRLLWVLPSHKRIKFRKAVREYHHMITELIACREKLGKTQEEDLLDALIEEYKNFPNRQEARIHIRDELLFLLNAGHETTTATLCWAWMTLSLYPEIWKNLFEEIKTVIGDKIPTYEDIDKLPYLQAFIYEVLRCYPPAPSLIRQAVNDDEIDGFHIPANVQIDIPIYHLHKRQDYWDNPQAFDPKRFFDFDFDNEDYKYIYMPFGGGPTMCVGKNFALTEVCLTMAIILQRYRLYLPTRFELTIAPLSIVRQPQLDFNMYVRRVPKGKG